jgi:hypothetical protein
VCVVRSRPDLLRWRLPRDPPSRVHPPRRRHLSALAQGRTQARPATTPTASGQVFGAESDASRILARHRSRHRSLVVGGTLERVLRRYVRAELLVIDDFAVLAMDPAQAKLAFQVISERYDFRRSTCITTNRAFKDWTKVFPDALNAQVIAERLTERAEHFVLEKGFRNARP